MRNYIIIGGSSGIGKSLAELMSEDKNQVFATYNQNTIEDQTNIKYFKFDALSDSLPLDNLPPEIHGLAYCPGSINLKPFHRFTSDEFMEDFKLQVLGATEVIKALLPRMKKADDSSIVLFSTVAVQMGFSFHSQVAMSKGAIEGLTRSLAAELAPKVRVNAIAPSLTNTPLADRLLNSPEKEAKQAAINPLQRVGTAKEVAEAAAYLLGTKSSWTTGQIMHIDGGFSSLK